jgi:hypothetical protein
MKIGSNHVMYCLNIHPGEQLEHVIAAIQGPAAQVKAAFAPDRPFAVGLRISSCAAAELANKTREFRALLDDQGMYAVTINGFPYGQFHATRVKENVYLPDWTSPERTTYTRQLAAILAELLPEGAAGSISTVPLYYGKTAHPAALNAIISFSDYLRNLEGRTGKRIVLALEPEPDCALDTLASTTEFFSRLFASAPAAQHYIGVCLDCCHAAVEFESPLDWLNELSAAGIHVPKIQVSAALAGTLSPTTRKKFGTFDEQVYLHQTRIRTASSIHHFSDLGNALNAGLTGDTRVHFHVPLGWKEGQLRATADEIEDGFFRALATRGGMQVEVETYSYTVLPGRTAAVTGTITADLSWLLARLVSPAE